MNLFEPERTQFDLNWYLFGIPVRVHPFFWLTTVIMGSDILRYDLEPPIIMVYLFLWVACVFVSVLVHEMGHVVMGQVFGSEGHIVLTAFFGLAVGSNQLTGRWQRVAVSFAGPLAEFLLIGLLLGGIAFFEPEPVLQMWDRATRLKYPAFFAPDWPDWANFLMRQAIWINLIWAFVNLLPVWPLDGGMISREVFQHFTPGNGLRWSLMLSLGTAGLLAFNGLISFVRKEPFIPFLGQGDMFTVIFFGIFAYGSWQLLQQAPTGGGRRHYRMEDESYEKAPWERDPDWWKRG